MIGEKRSYGSTEDLPSYLTGEAPNPTKRISTGGGNYKIAANIETDAHRLENRLKQCQYGKNTIGYDNYTAAVPRNKRHSNIDQHPRTPDPYEIQSKRAFEGRIKVWRRALHLWDSKGVDTSLTADVDAGSLDAAVAREQKNIAESTKTADDHRSQGGDTRDNQSRPGNNRDNGRDNQSRRDNKDNRSGNNSFAGSSSVGQQRNDRGNDRNNDRNNDRGGDRNNDGSNDRNNNNNNNNNNSNMNSRGNDRINDRNNDRVNDKNNSRGNDRGNDRNNDRNNGRESQGNNDRSNDRSSNNGNNERGSFGNNDRNSSVGSWNTNSWNNNNDNNNHGGRDNSRNRDSNDTGSRRQAPPRGNDRNNNSGNRTNSRTDSRNDSRNGSRDRDGATTFFIDKTPSRHPDQPPSTDEPQVILNEESMQSIDYERNMLNEPYGGNIENKADDEESDEDLL